MKKKDLIIITTDSGSTRPYLIIIQILTNSSGSYLGVGRQDLASLTIVINNDSNTNVAKLYIHNLTIC